MPKLQGKAALIMGHKRGPSLATAKHLIDEGAHVFLMNRGPDVAAAFDNLQTELTYVGGDTSDLRELDRLFAQIERERDKVEIVFANAIADEYPTISEILKDPYVDMTKFDPTGLLSAVAKALPLVRDGGSIILNTALVSGAKSTADSLYLVAKATVLSAAQIWSKQLEQRWIRVNAISSGTATAQPTRGSALVAGDSARSLPRTLPPGRLNTPTDVASAVVALLCDDACDVTGAEMIVEGGTTRLRMLSHDPPAAQPVSPDEIAQAVVYLASNDSKGITGMELFVDGAMAPL